MRDDIEDLDDLDDDLVADGFKHTEPSGAEELWRSSASSYLVVFLALIASILAWTQEEYLVGMAFALVGALATKQAMLCVDRELAKLEGQLSVIREISEEIEDQLDDQEGDD